MNPHPFYIALDTSNKEEFLQIVKELASYKCGFKIGMECFYSLGLWALETIKKQESSLFLDLKLHDIPNTTSKGIGNLVKNFSPELINIHISGGFEMMRKTQESVNSINKINNGNTKLIGVSVLTSLSCEDLKRTWNTSMSVSESVFHMGTLAKEAGLAGMVCSAQESMNIKNQIRDFITVTPGIRLSSTRNNDQKRVTTPYEARINQADYLVIGRGITQAIDRRKAFEDYLKNYNGEL